MHVEHLHRSNTALCCSRRNRQKDLEGFLEHTRRKFVGFSLRDDVTTLIGLPKPIHESIKILKQVRLHAHLQPRSSLVSLAFICSPFGSANQTRRRHCQVSTVDGKKQYSSNGVRSFYRSEGEHCARHRCRAIVSRHSLADTTVSGQYTDQC